jgi:hypothetical protein
MKDRNMNEMNKYNGSNYKDKVSYFYREFLPKVEKQTKISIIFDKRVYQYIISLQKQ